MNMAVVVEHAHSDGLVIVSLNAGRKLGELILTEEEWEGAIGWRLRNVADHVLDRRRTKDNNG